MYNDELQHYGVLGMKWGVRRGNTGRAYEKASKKLQRLDSKVEKSVNKAQKARVNADRKALSRFTSDKKAAKAETEARNAARKATLRVRKAQQWYKAMEKSFANTDITMSKAQIDMGRKYAQQMDMRALVI